MVERGHSASGLTLTATADGVSFAVRVTPRAGRDALAGVVAGVLRVRLAAPPVAGAANRALVAYLATRLDVPRRDLIIARGERGREKLVRVRGLAPEELHARVVAALA